MATDPGNFIAQMDLGTPSGTDPVSDGDEEIVAVKRMTRNSFEFINGAVLWTDVQMNAMIPRTDDATISGAWTFGASPILEHNIPLLGTDSDLTTLRNLINVFTDDAVTVGDVTAVMNLLGAAITSGAPHEFIEGAANAPGIHGATAGTGMRLNAAELGLSVGGVERALITALRATLNVPLQIQNVEMFFLQLQKNSGSSITVVHQSDNWAPTVTTASAEVLVTHNWGTDAYSVFGYGLNADLAYRDPLGDDAFTIWDPISGILDNPISVMVVRYY